MVGKFHINHFSDHGQMSMLDLDTRNCSLCRSVLTCHLAPSSSKTEKKLIMTKKAIYQSSKTLLKQGNWRGQGAANCFSKNTELLISTKSSLLNLCCLPTHSPAIEGSDLFLNIFTNISTVTNSAVLALSLVDKTSYNSS